MPRRIAALVTIPFILSGCAALHPARDVTSVTLRLRSAPIPGPVAAINGDSDMAPGRAAKTALPPAEMCQDMVAILCALVIPITVPIAAAVGATMKTSQQLPLEQVVDLNRVTADVAGQLDLRARFASALAVESQRRGITLSAANPDAEVIVQPQSLRWDIAPGNRAAMRIELEVTVQRDGDEDTHTVT
jgi:hypothetical protein